MYSPTFFHSPRSIQINPVDGSIAYFKLSMAIGRWSAFDRIVNTAGAFNNIISVEMRNDKEKTILAIKLSGLCAFSLKFHVTKSSQEHQCPERISPGYVKYLKNAFPSLTFQETFTERDLQRFLPYDNS